MEEKTLTAEPSEKVMLLKVRQDGIFDSWMQRLWMIVCLLGIITSLAINYTTITGVVRQNSIAITKLDSGKVNKESFDIIINNWVVRDKQIQDNLKEIKESIKELDKKLVR